MTRYFPIRPLLLVLLAVALLTCAVALTACRPSIPLPPVLAASPVVSTPSEQAAGDSAALGLRLPAFRFDAPQRADFAPTPGGERRYVRALRAVTPRKLGPGAVYAPANTGSITATTAIGKKSQALQADSGATVNQSQKPKGPQAVGTGATATNTESTGWPWWWWLIIAAGLYAVYRAFNRLT